MEEVNEKASQEINADQEEVPDFATSVKTIGSIVEFGAYEQDNDLTNGPEPIEWIVLDVQERKSLLISRYGLECMPFNEKKVSVTWKTSSLRQWLYKDFPRNAFSALEQERILVTNTDNGRAQGNSEWTTDGGPSTQDKVFLLSYAEAERYFESSDSRKCGPTEYAKSRNAYTDGNGFCWWWLRSPGYNQKYAADVYQDGALGNDCNVSNNTLSVRPALWISNDMKPEDLERIEEERLEALQEKWSFLRGSEVSFGSYEQDNDLTNGPEPVEWTVLDVQGGKALLISKFGLDSQRFNSTQKAVTWETCMLRSWLNNEFHSSAFSDHEKEFIEETSVDNGWSQGNPKWRTNGGNNTNDRIFILSFAEAREFYGSDHERTCQPTEYAVSQGTNRSSRTGNCWYWLRSPGYSLYNVASVATDGSLSFHSIRSDYGAVRPAMWIDLETLIS